MPDPLSKEARSGLMAKVRSRGNRSTEEKLAAHLRREKIHGWRRHAEVYGKPDFVFRSARLAMFVDGCFWHGCPRCYRRPQSNTTYWDRKVARNMARDKAVAKVLRAKGWRVLRIWEHELRRDAATRCLQRLRRALEKAADRD